MRTDLFLLIARTLVSGATASLLFGAAPNHQPSSGERHNQNAQVSPASLIRIDAVVTREDGTFVSGLGPENFAVEQDGAPQQILSLDHYNASDAGTVGKVDELLKLKNFNTAIDQQIRQILLTHRLIVFFFDKASLTPEELNRSVNESMRFIQEQMSATDLVAVVSFGTGYIVNVDFTNDKVFLKSGLASLTSTKGTSSADSIASICPKDTTYCEEFTRSEVGFDTLDSRNNSEALLHLTTNLMTIPGRKSMIRFTGSLQQIKESDSSALGVIKDIANFALISLYEVNLGKRTHPHGGDPTNPISTNTAQLAGQARGELFADTNDFSAVIQKLQQDSKEYYLLICKNTDVKYDGRVRNLSVRLQKVPRAKLAFRPVNFRMPSVEF